MAGQEVGSLYYDLNIDDKNLKKQLDDADKSVKGFGDKISAYWGNSVDASKKFGLALAGITAGVVAFGVSSVKSFEQSQAVMAQTEAVLKSTGNAAGITADQVTKLASALEKQTKFADEDIQSAENLLLTFTSIGKDIFPDATKTVLDMSTALGQDLKSSSVQLGKALQDPINGITALRRVGVNFSDAQQEVIAKLVETGKKAEAQKLILKELQTEFGGSAVAAGNTFAGQLAKLNNQFDNVKESIGGLIAAVAVPFLTAIMDWFEGIGGVDGVLKLLREELTKLKPYLPIIAGIIAGMLVPALAALIGTVAGFIATMAPWAAAGAAVVLIAQRMGVTWDDVKAALDKLQPVLKSIWDGLFQIDDLAKRFVNTLIDLWQRFTNLSIIIVIGQYLSQVLWPALQAVWAAIIQNLWPALQQLWDAVVRLWNALNPALVEALKIIGIIIGGLLMAALWALVAVLNIAIQVFSMIISVISNVINWISNLISWFGNLVGVVWNTINTVISIIKNLPAAVKDVVGLIGSIFSGVPKMIKDAFGDAYHLLYDFGKWILWGLKDGILSVIGSIKDVAGNIGGAIKDKVKSILGINSPSRVFYDIGKNVTEGFVQGVEGSIHLAANAMSGFNNAIMAPSMPVNPSAASGSGDNSTTHNYGSTTVNIGTVEDRQDADYILQQLDRSQQLVGMGLSS